MHKAFICAVSPYFYRAFNGGFKEARSGMLELQSDISAGNFAVFLEWLYTKSIDTAVSSVESDSSPDPGSDVYLELYIFAHEHEIDRLCTDAFEAFSYDYAGGNYMDPRPPKVAVSYFLSPAFVNRAFSKLEHTSSFCEELVKLAVEQGFPSDDKNVLAEYDRGFLHSVAARLSKSNQSRGRQLAKKEKMVEDLETQNEKYKHDLERMEEMLDNAIAD